MLYIYVRKKCYVGANFRSRRSTLLTKQNISAQNLFFKMEKCSFLRKEL